MHEIIKVLHVVACHVFFGEGVGDDGGGQNWLGGLLKLNKNGQFLVFLAV